MEEKICVQIFVQATGPEAFINTDGGENERREEGSPAENEVACPPRSTQSSESCAGGRAKPEARTAPYVLWVKQMLTRAQSVLHQAMKSTSRDSSYVGTNT